MLHTGFVSYTTLQYSFVKIKKKNRIENPFFSWEEIEFPTLGCKLTTNTDNFTPFTCTAPLLQSEHGEITVPNEKM